MAERSRIRRILKWTGLIVCVLIVVAWGVSLRWGFGYVGDRRGVTSSWGVMRIRMCNIATGSAGWITADLRGVPYPWGGLGWGLCLPSARRDVVDVGLEDFTRATLRLLTVNIPSWLPLVVVAIPTAFLWYRDRRRIPPGHCRKCGYDLTGNTSGRCSECGTTI